MVIIGWMIGKNIGVLWLHNVCVYAPMCAVLVVVIVAMVVIVVVLKVFVMWWLRCRMDMVVSAGKSRKNVNAFVLLPPDTRQAIDLLLDTRAAVGVKPSNVFIFSRLNADSAMAGHTEMQELAHLCPDLKFPERITSRRLRTYIATVSQVS